MNFLASALPASTAQRLYSLSRPMMMAFLLSACCGLSVQAMPGDLDSTFGIGGKVVTAIDNRNDQVNAIATQTDGKIVAAGSTSGTSSKFALVRYNTDGSLDSTFGTSGKVVTAIGTSADDEAFAVAVQPDGKIIAAGITGPPYDFALVRYNTDGSPDSTFGTGGKVVTSFGSGSDLAASIAIQRDGKIIAAGSTEGATQNFALARYNTDGSLDSTFGAGGKAVGFLGNNNEAALAVTLQPDGKIIAAGGGASPESFVLERFNTDGSLDSTFGVGGIVLTDFLSRTQANAVVIQPDGKIIAAGFASNKFALARYNANGSLDSTFDTDGKVITAISNSVDQAFAVVLQLDGKIVAAGFTSGTTQGFALARYNTDGSLDSTFGAGGIVVTPLGSLSAQAHAITIQSDGKIVAAGYAYTNGTANDFALVRYLGPSFALLTEENSNGAIALDSVTLQRGPFSLFNSNNFSADQRTRISLFASYLGLPPGNNSTAITAQAEDAQHRIYPLTIEYAGQVPNFYWLNQVSIKLPDELQAAGDVSISINYHGVTSNPVAVRIQ